MLVRTALFIVILTSSAQAGAIDDLKHEFAECLRFELNGAGQHERVAARALGQCSQQIVLLDRADGRRLRSNRSLNPSSWSVIEGDVGRGARGRFAGLLD